MDKPIIVTGCQRSGTNIASHILANSKQYALFEEDLWKPNYHSIKDLRSFIDKEVDQSFHHRHHRQPGQYWYESRPYPDTY